MLNIRDGVQCYLMREEQHFGSSIRSGSKKSKNTAHTTATISATDLEHLFLYFDVTEFRNIIITQLGKPTDNSYQKYLATAEYIFLCSFMGNDFVPASSILRIADEGIEQIVEIYHEIVPIDQYILQHNTTTHLITVNLEYLHNIFSKLAIYERDNGIKLEEEMKLFQLRFSQQATDVEVAIK
jgi:5'-3' exonuclease